MAEFPLFIDLIRNVEMALAKADLGIASLYASLMPDVETRKRVFSKIEAEFNRTLAAVLAVTRQKELLETNRMLAHSIRLRNPYVDPMSLIQVDLLRRKRAGEDTDEINRAIASTINGISAGLRQYGLIPEIALLCRIGSIVDFCQGISGFVATGSGRAVVDSPHEHATAARRHQRHREPLPGMGWTAGAESRKGWGAGAYLRRSNSFEAASPTLRKAFAHS